MTLDPTFEEQKALADTRADRRRPEARGRERLGDLVLGLGFVLAAVGLCIVAPPHHVAVTGAVTSLIVMVIAMRVRFETPFGFSVATQLAFVPLMFAVPGSLLPAATFVAVFVAEIPEKGAGPSGMVRALSNSWFALGPAWVLALAGVHGSPPAAVLVGALLAEFALDFTVSSVALAVTRGARLVSLLRSGWIYAVDAALSAVGIVVAEQMRVTPFAVCAVVPLLGLLATFGRERSERLDGLLELNDTYRGTALLLGDMVAADDTYTGLHSQGVVELAGAVGDALGLRADQRRNLEFAALLHDVGKIAIPKAIINKPGALTDDEWALVRTHSVEGERMLARVGGFMTEVGTIVRSHHERWDGRGYPDGLSGDTAPLEARIITCCDSWSAMRTDRPYRPALSHAAAIEQLRVHSGGQFDPSVAAALLDVVRDGGGGQAAASVSSRSESESESRSDSTLSASR